MLGQLRRWTLTHSPPPRIPSSTPVVASEGVLAAAHVVLEVIRVSLACATSPAAAAGAIPVLLSFLLPPHATAAAARSSITTVTTTATTSRIGCCQHASVVCRCPRHNNITRAVFIQYGGVVLLTRARIHHTGHRRTDLLLPASILRSLVAAPVGLGVAGIAVPQRRRRRQGRWRGARRRKR